MIRHVTAMLAMLPVLLGAGVPAEAARDTTPGNTVVGFERFGEWEVWCIRLVTTGAVVCDLNIVLNYVPNPNFRGLIPRVYLDEAGTPFFEIETEFQTSLGRGWIEVPGQPRFAFAGCGRPCVIEGGRAADLIALLSSGGQATLRLHDYFIEAHDVPVALDGFVEGLAALRSMQAQAYD